MEKREPVDIEKLHRIIRAIFRGSSARGESPTRVAQLHIAHLFNFLGYKKEVIFCEKLKIQIDVDVVNRLTYGENPDNRVLSADESLTPSMPDESKLWNDLHEADYLKNLKDLLVHKIVSNAKNKDYVKNMSEADYIYSMSMLYIWLYPIMYSDYDTMTSVLDNLIYKGESINSSCQIRVKRWI